MDHTDLLFIYECIFSHYHELDRQGSVDTFGEFKKTSRTVSSFFYVTFSSNGVSDEKCSLLDKKLIVEKCSKFKFSLNARKHNSVWHKIHRAYDDIFMKLYTTQLFHENVFSHHLSVGL